MTVENAAKRVVVVGSGLTGTGCAHGFAASGFTVTLVDLDTAALARAVASIRRSSRTASSQARCPRPSRTRRSHV